MKITPWYLAALAPFAAIGCSGAYLGHAAVVVLTIGIFLGTLSLGRAPSPPMRRRTTSRDLFSYVKTPFSGVHAPQTADCRNFPWHSAACR